MKIRIFLLLMIIGCRATCIGQASFDYQPYFSSVIVNNIERSVLWYKSVFSLQVKSETNDVQNGYKVAILEGANFLVELLELKGSLVPATLLEGKGDGTKIQGHFKLGFKVSDVDACLNRLSRLNIEVPQVWEDKATKKRNFIIKDPDGNLIQFFD
jgi:hypothetical protein